LTQKLKFTIEDAKVINENPSSNFAILDLDFFASGENLHEMYVSEETLLKTADTIKNCPLVWEYDDVLDDVGTHNRDEVPCGFVPESSTVQSKKLPDGRTMLSVVAYVWKRYTGEILNFFKRDGGKKPVSVEMSVYNTKTLPNGLIELLDFKYDAITVLGSFVKPAIPSAVANVLSFAEIKTEYKKVLKEEFSNIDMLIPESVKENAKAGLELRKQYNRGGTASSLAFARYLINNRNASPENVRQVAEHFSQHKKDVLKQNPPENVDWLLWGGTASKEWAESIVDELDKKDELEMSELVTFPYKSMKDVNPSLKGIEPPISLAQANAIAKQADAVGTNDEKNGWAIAISSFKKGHTVQDGKWVKRESMSGDEFAKEDLGKDSAISADKSKKEEMSVEKTKEELLAIQETELAATTEVEMAKPIEDSPEEEKKESPEEEKKEEMAKPVEDSPEEEKKESPEEEKKEEMAAKPAEGSPEEEKKEDVAIQNKEEEVKGPVKGFAYPKDFNMETMSKLFADDDSDEVKMAKEEMAKEFCNPEIMMGAMYATMCKMAVAFEKLVADNHAYMAENEELKKFKAAELVKEKFAVVDSFLADMAGKVVIPEDAMDEFRTNSEKFSLEQIDAWKNECKAKSFDFAVKETSESKITRVAFPHSNTTWRKSGNDPWAGTK
jgi:hypothetical protein